MGTDDPGTAGLAEEKQKSHKPAFRVLAFALPLRAAHAPVFLERGTGVSPVLIGVLLGSEKRAASE